MVNKRGQKIGIAEEFYDGGQLKKKYTYRNDTLNGEFEAYFENGGIESKGFFWNDKPVGPTIYYGKDGKIRLYNELDFNGDIYYVKKYDDNQKVIKEEGVAVSPNILIYETKKDSLPKDSLVNIFFFYSEPEGSKNTILCYIDSQRVQANYTEHHLALIQKRFSQSGIHELKVVSILNNEADMQSTKDSIIKKITIH